MVLHAVDEYNDGGHLIYAQDQLGAFVRGRTREEALAKFPAELQQYFDWIGEPFDPAALTVEIVQEHVCPLQVCDADSEVIFDTERKGLSMMEYLTLKMLVLRSAANFQMLYASIPDKDHTVLPARETFYGAVPVTAREMYLHTRNVNSCYFGEIGVDAANEPDILTCREEGFSRLEKQPDALSGRVFAGSYGEEWSLRKVCRRFLWHDRIHARAMYRMAVRLCGADAVADPFRFHGVE